MRIVAGTHIKLGIDLINGVSMGRPSWYSDPTNLGVYVIYRPTLFSFFCLHSMFCHQSYASICSRTSKVIWFPCQQNWRTCNLIQSSNKKYHDNLVVKIKLNYDYFIKPWFIVMKHYYWLNLNTVKGVCFIIRKK